MRPMHEPYSPAALLELAAGYQRSKILFAMVELKIPTLLAEGPRTAAEIAASLGADPLAVDRLLHACVALGLLIRDDAGFRNAPEAQRFLVHGAPDDLGDVFRHYERESASPAWAAFAHRLRAWRPGAPHDSTSREFAPVGDELRGQHRLSLLAGDALGKAFDLSAHRRLLDLGGGTGAMSIALCRRYSGLCATILERPAIAPAARTFVRESGLGERIDVAEGDFVEGTIPVGADVVLLANVLSMSSAAAHRALLRRVFEYLPAGGAVVLSGWMLDDDDTGPLMPLLFSMQDVLLRAPDVERSAANYGEWLAEAGFVEIERMKYFDPATLVIGRKPGA